MGRGSCYAEHAAAVVEIKRLPRGGGEIHASENQFEPTNNVFRFVG